MSKFKITVIRTDEYEIECNWSESKIKGWSEHFYPGTTQEDIAKHFAVSFMRNENNYFIEGFGHVKEYHKDGSLKSVLIRDNQTGKLRKLREDEYTIGISICPISQDDDYETEIEQLETLKEEQNRE